MRPIQLFLKTTIWDDPDIWIDYSVCTLPPKREFDIFEHQLDDKGIGKTGLIYGAHGFGCDDHPFDRCDHTDFGLNDEVIEHASRVFKEHPVPKFLLHLEPMTGFIRDDGRCFIYKEAKYDDAYPLKECLTDLLHGMTRQVVDHIKRELEKEKAEVAA